MGRAQQSIELPFVPTSYSKGEGAESEDEAPSPHLKALGGMGPMGRHSSNARRQNTPWKITLSIIAYMAWILVMHLLCSQTTSKTLGHGVVNRRLAVGGESDDEEGEQPPSPGLENLCFELGPWIPPESSPDMPRGSPVMVEEFFKALEGDVEESKGAADSQEADERRGSPVMVEEFFKALEEDVEESEGAADSQEADRKHQGGKGAKRPAPEEADNEQPGPSQKVFITDTVTALGKPSAWQRLEASGQPGPRQSEAGAPQPSTSGLAGQVMPPTPSARIEESAGHREPGVDGEQPSTSRAASGLAVDPTSADATSKHPYVCVPVLAPGVTPRPFRSWLLNDPVPMARQLFPTLYFVRELLLKAVLDVDGANALVSRSEELASYARHRMTSAVSHLVPAHAAASLARRFIVLHNLNRIGRALETPVQTTNWWAELLRHIPTDYSKTRYPRDGGHLALANALSATLQQYKDGNAPSDDQVISILQMLFCSDPSLSEFIDPKWDPWREDGRRQ